MDFVVEGKMVLGPVERIFSKKVSAPSENAAKDKTYALIGSNNGLTRNKIKIEKITKVQ
ncbi:50S ribosomal protein L18a [Candidatus Micrarchaeota archaeon]|nr:50S ribosomal protein L18a [Candidatus Micrarchaeota archaeon]